MPVFLSWITGDSVFMASDKTKCPTAAALIGIPPDEMVFRGTYS
jgi:hypothetical protein